MASRSVKVLEVIRFKQTEMKRLNPCTPLSIKQGLGKSALTLGETQAMRDGKAIVTQCSSCGTFVYLTYVPQGKLKLGPCPACGGQEWWLQRTSVGPFSPVA